MGCHLSPYLPDLPMFNTTGVLLTRNGSQVSASFDGTVTISVIALSNILHASSSLPEEYRNHTQGLLGKKGAQTLHRQLSLLWAFDSTPSFSSVPQGSEEAASPTVEANFLFVCHLFKGI